MRAVLIALIALLPTTALADRSYNSERNVTHDCAKDSKASVNVSGGTFTFTGPCDKISINGSLNTIKVASAAKLAINGSKNTADIDAIDKLSVTGSENTVTYKRGVSGKPKVASLGTNNKITLIK